MRTPYDIEYYEQKLKQQYNHSYSIIPITEWHGLRTIVRIHCLTHDTMRQTNLQKIFNGKKSTVPCRFCRYPSPTE